MRPALFLSAILFAAALSGPAPAQPFRAPGVQPLDRILPQVRRAHPGEFYDADGPMPGPNGSEHYHLKWMTPDGRIEWLDTDARTGRVLGTSPGRDTFDAPEARRNFAPAPSFPVPQQFGPGPYGGYSYGEGRGGFGGRGFGEGRGHGGQRRGR